MTRLSIIFILLIPLCGGIGCDSKPAEQAGRPADRATLIDALQSFDTPGEAKAKLDANLLPWKVIEQPKPQPPSDKRPPFNQFIVRVTGYLYLNRGGDLELRFLNDRLMEVRFYPDDAKSFLTQLREQQHIDLLENKEISIGAHGRVWTWTGPKGGTYVGWGDTRLQKESEDWIRQYS